MKVASDGLRPAPTKAEPAVDPQRLHDLTQRAIAASAALTSACIAGRAVNDAQYARIDHAAYTARRDLLDCLDHDYGIDKVMADQLGALL